MVSRIVKTAIGITRDNTGAYKGGEQHDSDKEPWNAFTRNLAHLNWPVGCARWWNSNDTYFAGYSRYCCWCLYLNW